MEPFFSERVAKQTVDVSGPQVMEDTAEDVRLIPLKRTQQCTAEEIVACPAPQLQDQFAVEYLQKEIVVLSRDIKRKMNAQRTLCALFS